MSKADAVYGLGVIGALVYFLSHVTTIDTLLWGIVKSVIWPALLVYRALGFFGF